MSAGSSLAQVHAWIAGAAGAVAVALVLVGLVAALRPGAAAASRRWLDRLVLVLLAVVAVAAVLGPVVLLVAGPPRDWLHLLYAVLALGAVPAARLVAAQRRSPRVGAWVAAGGLVTLGVLLRLWGTGG